MAFDKVPSACRYLFFASPQSLAPSPQPLTPETWYLLLGLQLYDRRPGAAFVGRSKIELFHVRVRSKHLVETLPKDAFAVPVDDAQPKASGHVSFVKELIYTLAGKLGGVTNNVELHRGLVRAPDGNRRPWSACPTMNDPPDLAPREAHVQVAYGDVSLVIIG